MSSISVPGLLSLFSSVAGSGLQIGQGFLTKSAQDSQAEQIEDRAQQTLAAMRIAALKERGAMRAGYARAGVDPNRGSPVDAIAEDAYWRELDAQRAYFNELRAAKEQRRRGTQAVAEGAANAAGSLLDVYGRRLVMEQAKGSNQSVFFTPPGGQVDVFDQLDLGQVERRDI